MRQSVEIKIKKIKFFLKNSSYHPKGLQNRFHAFWCLRESEFQASYRKHDLWKYFKYSIKSREIVNRHLSQGHHDVLRQLP